MSARAHILVLTEALLLLITTLSAICATSVSSVHVVGFCLVWLDRIILGLLISHVSTLDHG